MIQTWEPSPRGKAISELAGKGRGRPPSSTYEAKLQGETVNYKLVKRFNLLKYFGRGGRANRALAVRPTSSKHHEISHHPAVWRAGRGQRHPGQDSGDDSQFLSLRLR